MMSKATIRLMNAGQPNGRKFHPEQLEEATVADAVEAALSRADEHPEMDLVDLIALEGPEED